MQERAKSGERPRGEFLCPGCGRPLDIELRSGMCFAEAQVHCPACERDYQAGRGKWADRFTLASAGRGFTPPPAPPPGADGR